MIRVREVTHDDMPILIEMGALMHETTEFRHLEYDRKKVIANGHAWIDSPNHCTFTTYNKTELTGMFVGFKSTYYFGSDTLSKDLLMFVLSAYRGGRSALLLMNAYVSWALSVGVTDIIISASTGGEQAEQANCFYEHYGFKNIGGIYRRSVDV
jgi:GNAT superfamily N-acetyltransferase